MKVPTNYQTQNGKLFEITLHARKRMNARRLSDFAIKAALEFGRVAYVRGAAIYAIGRKEKELYSKEGIDLAPHEGVQVVCTPKGDILTVYRNRDFRGLRPFRRRYRSTA